MQNKKGVMYSVLVILLILISSTLLGKPTMAIIATVIWSTVYLTSSHYLAEKVRLSICLDPKRVDTAYLVAQAYVLVPMALTAILLGLQLDVLPLLCISICMNFAMTKGAHTIGVANFKPTVYSMMLVLVFSYSIYMWKFSLFAVLFLFGSLLPVFLYLQDNRRFIFRTILGTILFTFIMYLLNRNDPTAISTASWSEIIRGNGLISALLAGNEMTFVYLEWLKFAIVVAIAICFGYSAIRNKSRDYGKSIASLLSLTACINFTSLALLSLFTNNNTLNPFGTVIGGAISSFVLAIINPLIEIKTQEEYASILDKYSEENVVNNS